MVRVFLGEPTVHGRDIDMEILYLLVNSDGVEHDSPTSCGHEIRRCFSYTVVDRM